MVFLLAGVGGYVGLSSVLRISGKTNVKRKVGNIGTWFIREMRAWSHRVADIEEQNALRAKSRPGERRSQRAAAFFRRITETQKLCFSDT